LLHECGKVLVLTAVAHLEEGRSSC
jgi:hypothetical protein